VERLRYHDARNFRAGRRPDALPGGPHGCQLRHHAARHVQGDPLNGGRPDRYRADSIPPLSPGADRRGARGHGPARAQQGGPTSMKAIANVRPGILKLLDLPLPEPGAGQVRIRTAACGICATDLAMITGWERTPFPAIPGHEWAGSVDALGAGVDGAWVGRRVVADNLWAAGGEVGFEHPGGYAQYFITEAANLQLLPPGTPCALAALAEPLAVAVHALGRLGQDAPGPVLICGDGPIGLLLLALLRRAGRDDLVFAGGRAGRLALAARWGAAQTIDYHARDLRRQRTGGFGSIVEASGSPAAQIARVI